MNWRRSAVLRKSVALSKRQLKWLKRIPRIHPLPRQTLTPPFVVNSFPKSGTHLLLQIIEALPGLTNYGEFLASTPSIPFQERSEAQTLRIIRGLVPGEIMCAHLFFKPSHAQAIDDLNALQFFLYRDLRDVAVSEAHYLAHANRWHRMHRYFKALPTTEGRIQLSIEGVSDPDFPYPYPNIAQRFSRYHGWFQRQNVFAVRFEDLIGPDREATIRRLAQWVNARAPMNLNDDEITSRVVSRLDPNRSHTFRSGQAGGWRKAFTPQLKQRMKDVAGSLLIELGYEQNLDW